MACTGSAALSVTRRLRNHVKKIIGKPCAGKPHARIERGHVMGTPSAQTLVDMASEFFRELEEVPMTIVGGFDVHRKQITFDYVDTGTGLVRCGEIRPATRKTLRSWLGRTMPGRGCGDSGGGLHRVAVCGRGTGRGGCDGPSG